MVNKMMCLPGRSSTVRWCRRANGNLPRQAPALVMALIPITQSCTIAPQRIDDPRAFGHWLLQDISAWRLTPFLLKDSRIMSKQPPIADADPKDQHVQIHDPEAELLRLYGDNTLAFFGLAPKNRHFLAPGGAGLVNYQLMRKIAVVLGDPVCAPEAREQVTRSFLDICAQHRWRVAFYQASPERLAVYHSLHLRTFKMG